MHERASTITASDRQHTWRQDYVLALQHYLADGGEHALRRAYELGRTAFGRGVNLLDVIMAHQGAVEQLLPLTQNGREEAVRTRLATEFLAESLSPFEIAHRAFFDTNVALREFNLTLENEARRIARLLHDGAGQILFALELALGDLAREGASIELLGEIRGLTYRLDEQLRCLSHELHPVVLEDSGLVQAVELLAGRISKQTGLQIGVATSLDQRLPETIEQCLYRTIHEALTNVLRHSNASEVTIEFDRTSDTVSCVVRDNGVGVPDQDACPDGKGGLGLVGMRVRLRELDGALQVRSLAGTGTELILSVPLPASP